jgi:hypothetical protein
MTDPAQRAQSVKIVFFQVWREPGWSQITAAHGRKRGGRRAGGQEDRRTGGQEFSSILASGIIDAERRCLETNTLLDKRIQENALFNHNIKTSLIFNI